MGFLRTLGLEEARSAHRAADPRRDSVTGVATRFGFYELGRFAGLCRRAFGESPSETLSR